MRLPSRRALEPAAHSLLLGSLEEGLELELSEKEPDGSLESVAGTRRSSEQALGFPSIALRVPLRLRGCDERA